MTPTSSKHNYDGIDMGEGSLGFPKRLTSLTEEGRKWFARGWMHAIDFHHEAAIECFKSCIEVDGSNCAMAFYGIGELGCVRFLCCFPPLRYAGLQLSVHTDYISILYIYIVGRGPRPGYLVYCSLCAVTVSSHLFSSPHTLRLF